MATVNDLSVDDDLWGRTFSAKAYQRELERHRAQRPCPGCGTPGCGCTTEPDHGAWLWES